MFIFQFVRACRSGDFNLYIETLDRLMPWIMAMDHTHYSRNVPVHLRDMATLQEQHPALYIEYLQGHFVGQKTDRAFSRLPLDQMHEQMNDWLKNEAGIIGNLDDPRTVRREQVARPEMARLLRELEQDGTGMVDEKHHEQFHKYQQNFQVILMVSYAV